MNVHDPIFGSLLLFRFIHTGCFSRTVWEMVVGSQLLGTVYGIPQLWWRHLFWWLQIYGNKSYGGLYCYGLVTSKHGKVVEVFPYKSFGAISLRSIRRNEWIHKYFDGWWICLQSCRSTASSGTRFFCLLLLGVFSYADDAEPFNKIPKESLKKLRIDPAKSVPVVWTIVGSFWNLGEILKYPEKSINRLDDPGANDPATLPSLTNPSKSLENPQTIHNDFRASRIDRKWNFVHCPPQS